MMIGTKLGTEDLRQRSKGARERGREILKKADCEGMQV
jgi:hypothetical protein